jgi:hypothetical protein
MSRLIRRARSIDYTISSWASGEKAVIGIPQLNIISWRNHMIRFKVLGALAFLSIFSFAQPPAFGGEGRQIGLVARPCRGRLTASGRSE